MNLFDSKIPDPCELYEKLRSRDLPFHWEDEESTRKKILEGMWHAYESYADSGFVDKFARATHDRFWEMQLTLELIKAGKNVRKREKLPKAKHDAGPDICIIEPERKIWIEATCPGPGDDDNPDRVPDYWDDSDDLVIDGEVVGKMGKAKWVTTHEIELRITGALEEKRKCFEKWREEELIGADDLCIVAISGAQICKDFPEEAYPLPLAASAVYPIGGRTIGFPKGTGDAVDLGYSHSPQIGRADSKTPIDRDAFLRKEYAGICGLIWSTFTIYRVSAPPDPFVTGRNDFVFIPNIAALPNSLPRRWLAWNKECICEPYGNGGFRIEMIDALGQPLRIT